MTTPKLVTVVTEYGGRMSDVTATCQGCGWHFSPDWPIKSTAKTRRAAREHALQTGHTTVVDVVRSFIFEAGT